MTINEYNRPVRGNGDGRRMTDSSTYNMVKLILTAFIMLTPPIAGIFILYGNIRVLTAQQAQGEERLDRVEQAIYASELVSREELMQAMERLEQTHERHLRSVLGYAPGNYDLRKKQILRGASTTPSP